jgi:hypothetical protein
MGTGVILFPFCGIFATLGTPGKGRGEGLDLSGKEKDPPPDRLLEYRERGEFVVGSASADAIFQIFHAEIPCEKCVR